MKIIRTDSAERVGEYIRDCFQPPESALIYSGNEAVVSTGQLATLDLKECARRGLYVGKWEYLAGTIVVMPGDLSICITTWGDCELAPQIVDLAAAWLSARGINITRDENDVLADGKKVVSWARARTLQGWCQSVVHFSIGAMDLELVQAICTKPMTKIPGSLGEYGITAEEMWELISPIVETE